MKMDSNPFYNALAQLSRATKFRTFHSDLLARLQVSEREITASIPVRMEDGSTRIFEGYRIQHSGILGPYKGGIRFHPETNIEEVRALAFWMTMKTAVAGLPMGGGKGGVTVDPKLLSARELEALSRGWVRRLYPVLGPRVDVPAPDVNTNSETMAWMVDEYEKITGDTTGAAFTGKPIDRGGSQGRTLATAMGGFFVFGSLARAIGLPQKCTVAIQGMGNVGGNTAHIFAKHNHTVVAMSDSRGAIYNRHGLNVGTVEAHKKERGSLLDFADAEYISNEALLSLPVDVLIPAALENQITKENADTIQAKLILELANGPTTPTADDALFARGRVVVPDILANAGGVIVSTFEWEQNLKGEHWSEEIVFKKLEQTLQKEADNIYLRAQALRTDLRRAAFVVALERLEKAF